MRSLLELLTVFLVLPHRALPRWHGETARRMWPFARWAVAASVMEFLLQNVDYVLVGRMLGAQALGFYTIAFRLAIIPMLTITLVVASVAFPAAVKLVHASSKVQELSRTSLRLGCASVFLFGTGLAALAPFLQILGTRWYPAVPVARLLGIYVCLRSASHLITPALRALGRPGIIAAMKGLWVLALVALIWTFGKRGIVVVAGIQVGLAAVMLVVHVTAGHRLLGIGIGAYAADIMRPAAAAVPAVVVVSAIPVFAATGIDHTAVQSLLAMGAVFCILYVSSLLIIDRSFAADLRQLRSLVQHRPVSDQNLL
jgi:O-antigen/teichoic acid export membrane protein